MSFIHEANLHWRYTDGERLDMVMPWYTLPCLEWLVQQPLDSWRVFEFGTGLSAFWWRFVAKKYQAVDHDERWARATMVDHESRDMHYTEMALMLCDVNELYDCIIVDGILRDQCIIKSLDCVKPGGFLIIDNYGSEDHDPSKDPEELQRWGKQLFKQPNHSSWTTALFQKPSA